MVRLSAGFRRISPVEARIAARSHRPSVSPAVTPDLIRGPGPQVPLSPGFPGPRIKSGVTAGETDGLACQHRARSEVKPDSSGLVPGMTVEETGARPGTATGHAGVPKSEPRPVRSAGNPLVLKPFAPLAKIKPDSSGLRRARTVTRPPRRHFDRAQRAEKSSRPGAASCVPDFSAPRLRRSGRNDERGVTTDDPPSPRRGGFAHIASGLTIGSQP